MTMNLPRRETPVMVAPVSVSTKPHPVRSRTTERRARLEQFDSFDGFTHDPRCNTSRTISNSGSSGTNVLYHVPLSERSVARHTSSATT